MLLRYTNRTAKVFRAAYESALSYLQQYLGTEHLIQGILAEGDGKAYEALTEQGLTSEIYQEAMNRINSISARNVELTSQPQVDELMKMLTPRTKRVLELAIMEANRSGRNKPVEPEDLLAGIIREGESVGYRVLRSLGIDPKALYLSLRGQTTAGAQGGRGSGRGQGGGETPTLDRYGRDMTQRVHDGKTDPIIGRSEEINRVMQILVNPVSVKRPWRRVWPRKLPRAIFPMF